MRNARNVQYSICESLRLDYAVVIPVIQIGCFWQSAGPAAQALSESLGLSTYYLGDSDIPYSGFPITAAGPINELRNQERSWALIPQVGRQGSLIIRRCMESSEKGVIGLEFCGPELLSHVSYSTLSVVKGTT